MHFTLHGDNGTSAPISEILLSSRECSLLNILGRTTSMFNDAGRTRGILASLALTVFQPSEVHPFVLSFRSSVVHAEIQNTWQENKSSCEANTCRYVKMQPLSGIRGMCRRCRIIAEYNDRQIFLDILIANSTPHLASNIIHFHFNKFECIL